MADMSQVVLGAIAVSVMVLVPIGCVLVWDLVAGRWDASISRWREKRAEKAEHRRAVRALRDPQGIPLEQLAYDRLMMQICAMLSIEHEPAGGSIGVEADIERFRVEA